jgi:3-isopropylmalate dehydrogenase
MKGNTKTLVVMPGEGIGIEVIGEVRRVVDWFDRRRQIGFTVKEELYGVAAYEKHGAILRETALPELKAADAVLFGATGSLGWEKIPVEIRKRGSLLRIRRELELFANFRPVCALPALAEASSLKPRVLEGVDLVVVRELTGGMYFGEPRGVTTLSDGEKRGVNTHVYTTPEIRRIARAAFELARTRRKRVHSVDKANVMEAGALWRETVAALHTAEFPDVELLHMLADNCAMQLGRAPAQFDVILTDNLFGDLLSDAAAPIMGSLGMLASASLGPVKPDGRRHALYEPVHGSAPDIAGKGIANPLAAIQSFALALRWSLGAAADGDLLDRAVARALDGGARTADIWTTGTRKVSTREMGDAVLQALDELAA